jgi:hypothetical protein
MTAVQLFSYDVPPIVSSAPNLRLPVLSTTSASNWRACHRLYYFSNELRYQAAYVDENRRTGTLWHLGQEGWWRALQAIQQGRYRADHSFMLRDALINVRATDAGPFELAKVEALLYGYHARWVEVANDYEVLDVEVEFTGDLTNPLTAGISRTFQTGGRMDLVLRARTGPYQGRVVIGEHKTSSEDISAGSEYWQRLSLDPQISMYFHGARALGHEPVACLYDVVGKPAQRPLKATPEENRRYTKKTGTLDKRQRTEDETPDQYRDRLMVAIGEQPDKYYARATIVRLEEEERAAAYDTWRIAQEIQETRRAAKQIGDWAWTRNPDACRKYGNACDFLPVCLGHAGLNDRTRFKEKEKR